MNLNKKRIFVNFLLRKNYTNINENDKKINFVSKNSGNTNKIVEIKYKIDRLLDSKNCKYCKSEWLNLFERCKNSTVSELRMFCKFNYKHVEISPNNAL